MARKRTLLQIEAEIAKLQREADEIRASEKAGVIDRIKEALAHYGITTADLGLAGGKRGPKPKAVGQLKTRQPRKARDAVAGPGAKKAKASRAGRVRFKDEAGNAWSGFGPKPKWLREALDAGKALDDFKA